MMSTLSCPTRSAIASAEKPISINSDTWECRRSWMAVSFRYRLLDDFLKEWQLRKKQLREGEITKEEYLEWKLNWPQTADGCGRYEPKKKWRKE